MMLMIQRGKKMTELCANARIINVERARARNFRPFCCWPCLFAGRNIGYFRAIS